MTDAVAQRQPVAHVRDEGMVSGVVHHHAAHDGALGCVHGVMEVQSVSAEDTFEHDVPLTEIEPMIRRLAEKTWTASRKELRIARTVVLKLKTSEFKILTRSHTPSSPPSSCEEFTNIAMSLRDRVALNPKQRFRLVGVGLSNFRDPEDAAVQPALFE